MRLRSGRVIAGWSAIMIGFALTGVLLTTSGSQARHADAATGGPKALSSAGVGAAVDVERARSEARSGDSFNALVRELQSRDGIENTSPPFMWLASLAVSVVRPAGVLDLRLATFEGRRLTEAANDRDFHALVDRATSDGWNPMVRVRSKRSNELVSIHARVRGELVSLLVVTIDKGEAVVAQVSVKPDTVAEWLKDPGRIESRLR